MKRFLIVAATAVGFVGAGAGTASAQEALAKSSGCMTCHDIAKTKLAPAFKDTAAKYKGKADAEATLVAKISAKKDHPEVKAKPDDVKAIVKWILTL